VDELYSGGFKMLTSVGKGQLFCVLRITSYITCYQLYSTTSTKKNIIKEAMTLVFLCYCAREVKFYCEIVHWEELISSL
jgi:hypothetical protein